MEQLRSFLLGGYNDKNAENAEVVEKIRAEDVELIEKNPRGMNFKYNLWELPKDGSKTGFKWNVEVIRALKKIESEE